MSYKNIFEKLEKNFQEEKKVLLSLGINSWDSIAKLKDEEIYTMAQYGLTTSKNFQRLRCIAILISELEISPEEAGVLMHSGIASSKALIKLTPQELIQRTGRLERILQTERTPLVGLQKALELIQKAKKRQITN